MKSHKVLFLDRDGTINVDLGGGHRYVSRPEDLELIEGVGACLVRAKNAGFKVALVTNQAGIAKGITRTEDLDVIHRHLETLIERDAAKQGVSISEAGGPEGFRFDDIQVCPHHPDDRCLCRKPGVLMLQRSAKKLGANLNESYFIGDHIRDLEAAHNFGIKSLLVRTGHGQVTESALKKHPDLRPIAVASNLDEAVKHILSH